jgi:hypothetical protein
VNATTDALRRDLEDAATHLGIAHELRFHPMFGGLMAYLSERPCAWLGAAGLALKVTPSDRDELLALKGAAPFLPRPGASPSRQYVLLPREFTRDTPVFAAWLARGAAARRKPAR